MGREHLLRAKLGRSLLSGSQRMVGLEGMPGERFEEFTAAFNFGILCLHF